MKTLTFSALFLAILFQAAQASSESPPHSDLVRADWSLKQLPVLNVEPKPAIWKFVNSLWGNKDIGPGYGKLCEFRFANLRNSGKLSLVVSYDAGGTADCDDVDVFDKTRTGIADYSFPVGGGAAYFDDIADLNGDGRYELILDTFLAAPLGGDHCWATWPVIYAWTGDGYGDVSSQFKNYYQKQLTKMRRQLAAPQPTPAAPPVETYESQPPGVEAHFGSRLAGPSPTATPPEQPDRKGLDCDKAYEAKLERFLGVSRDAGMSDAIKWANSDDPQDRKFAALVLDDIGTTQAFEYLKTLSHDPDRNVAMSAKLLLNGVKTATVYPTVKGELIPLTPGYPPAK